MILRSKLPTQVVAHRIIEVTLRQISGHLLSAEPTQVGTFYCADNLEIEVVLPMEAMFQPGDYILEVTLANSHLFGQFWRNIRDMLSRWRATRDVPPDEDPPMHLPMTAGTVEKLFLGAEPPLMGDEE